MRFATDLNKIALKFMLMLFSINVPLFYQMKFKKYYKAVKEDVPGYDKDLIKAHIPLEQFSSTPSTPSPQAHSIHSNDFTQEFLMDTIDYNNNFQNMDQYSNGHGQFIDSNE